MAYAKLIGDVREVRSFKNTYDKCRKENKTRTECAAISAKEQAIRVMKRFGLSCISPLVSEKLVRYANIMSITKEYVDRCTTDFLYREHHLASCVIGALTQQMASIGTDVMSGGLILISPTLTPLAQVPTVAVGVAGLIKANEIGNDFGKVAVELVDYLIDHVSSEELEMIDVSKEVIVRDKNHTRILFEPRDVKMITQLVKVNHKIKNQATNLMIKYDSHEKKINSTINKLSENIVEFDKATKFIDVELKDVCVEKILDKIHNNHSSHNGHNHGNYGGPHAYANYSSSKGWSLQLSFNIGGSNNHSGRRGGGSSCVIL
jgi:hypothetical protein